MDDELDAISMAVPDAVPNVLQGPVIINGLMVFTDGTLLLFTDNTLIKFEDE